MLIHFLLSLTGVLDEVEERVTWRWRQSVCYVVLATEFIFNISLKFGVFTFHKTSNHFHWARYPVLPTLAIKPLYTLDLSTPRQSSLLLPFLTCPDFQLPPPPNFRKKKNCMHFMCHAYSKILDFMTPTSSVEAQRNVILSTALLLSAAWTRIRSSATCSRQTWN